MRCMKCGAPTEVAETRPFMGVMLRRARVCFNGHRFSSYEVPPGALDRRQLKAIQNGVADRQRAQHRKLAVLRAPNESASSLAKRLGITEARVRQIRKEVSP